MKKWIKLNAPLSNPTLIPILLPLTVKESSLMCTLLLAWVAQARDNAPIDAYMPIERCYVDYFIDPKRAEARYLTLKKWLLLNYDVYDILPSIHHYPGYQTLWSPHESLSDALPLVLDYAEFLVNSLPGR